MPLFCKTAGITDADWRYYWPRPSDFVQEAGFPPNKFKTRYPDADVFGDYARVRLHLKKLPTKGELQIATRELGTRTHRVYDRFGGISEFVKRFRDWLNIGPEEFRGILSYPGWERTGPVTPPLAAAALLPVRPFLPAGLQHLDILARGELPVGESSDLSINIQFERKCADAFQALGFEVTLLGQGKGRAPDALATARRYGYGVVIDAKVRKDGYKLGTDGRTFREYVVDCARRLRDEGVEKVYLAVIASRFRESDHSQLASYLADSSIRGITFFSATALMRIVEESIRGRATFDLGEFEKVLFGSRVLAQ